MRPRFLIWGVCFEKAVSLAPYWLNSLIEIGRWRHDLVLLGDSGLKSLSHPQLKVFDITGDIRKKYSLPRWKWSNFTATNMKPEIQYYVDLSQYDYALYLDMDILANTDRLEAMVESKRQTGMISVQKDIIPVRADRPFTGRFTLTPEEKVRWADVAVCAGMVGVPITETGMSLLKDWQAMNRKARFYQSDQAKLIALLVRQYSGKWDYLGDTVVARKVDRYPQTLLHFSAGRGDLMKRYYRETLRLPGVGASKPKSLPAPIESVRKSVAKRMGKVKKQWRSLLWGYVLWRTRPS